MDPRTHVPDDLSTIATTHRDPCDQDSASPPGETSPSSLSRRPIAARQEGATHPWSRGLGATNGVGRTAQRAFMVLCLALSAVGGARAAVSARAHPVLRPLTPPLADGAPGDGGPALKVHETTVHEFSSVDLSRALALKRDGSVWAWESKKDSATGRVVNVAPHRIPGLPAIVTLAGRYGLVLALTGHGDVWSWGENDAGQLGRGTSGRANPIPHRISTLTRILAIGAGDRFSLAVRGAPSPHR